MKSITVLLNLCLCIIVLALSFLDKSHQPDNKALSGDKDAIEKVDIMLEKLGGKESWSSLKSIYIDAIHTEDRLEKPYRSEIWRNLDGPQIKIVQTTDTFTSFRIIDKDKGWSKRDEQEWNTISEASLTWLLNWDNYLIYRTINRLAKNDNLQVQLKDENTLVLSEAGNFYALIELADTGLPYRYGVPGLQGDTTFTIYPKWKETDGLFHPEVSTNEDGTFHFESNVWEWSSEKIDKKFFSIQ